MFLQQFVARPKNSTVIRHLLDVHVTKTLTDLAEIVENILL